MELFGAGGVPRILLVEPSVLAQRNLALLLQQEGYDLVLARSPGEAREVIDAGGVDLLLISGDGQGTGALELVLNLRRSPSTFGLPVVVMFASFEQAEAVRNAVKKEVFQTLIKPVQSRELLDMLTATFLPLPVRGQDVLVRTPAGETPCRVKTVPKTSERDSQRFLLVAREEGGPLGTLFEGEEVEVGFEGPGRTRVSWKAVAGPPDPARRPGEGEASQEVRLTTFVGREDQRRFLRKTLAVPVRYRLPGDFYRLGTSVDLSMGGMRLCGVVSRDLPVGTRIELSIVLDASRAIRGLGAEIRRLLDVRGQIEWGVAFTDITPEQQDALLEVIFGTGKALAAAEAIA